LLLGLYTNILEKNNHLLIPESFREAYAAGLFITPGFDRNIMLLTLQAFQAIYDRITKLNLADPVARLLLRMLLGSAFKVEMSSEGRISIPDKLKIFADLEQEVILVGQGDFVEVWSPKVWDNQMKKLENLEADHFSALSITTR